MPGRRAVLGPPGSVAIEEGVAGARRDSPESEAWLGLLEAALGESEDGAMWEAAVPTAAERPIKAPVLSHAQITLDGRAARGWVRRLLRSEEHTSELQSPCNLVCRLLLEKKKKKTSN